MRIAFISDLHGNFSALNAVLADIDSQDVDQIISLGDTATLGPQPLEVIHKLREINAITIKGNHDEALLDPAHAGDYQITEHLLPDILWCRNQLTKADLSYIDSFLKTYEITFPNGVSVLCFHGSPYSSTDLILSTTPNEVLERYFGALSADVLIGGHSHIQMHRRYGEQLILNAGSVGNAFRHAYEPGNTPSLLPWAEYAILSQAGSSLNVDLRRIYFDTGELLKRVLESGLPGVEWWTKQYKNQPAKIIR